VGLHLFRSHSINKWHVSWAALVGFPVEGYNEIAANEPFHFSS